MKYILLNNLIEVIGESNGRAVVIPRGAEAGTTIDNADAQWAIEKQRLINGGVFQMPETNLPDEYQDETGFEYGSVNINTGEVIKNHIVIDKPLAEIKAIKKAKVTASANNAAAQRIYETLPDIKGKIDAELNAIDKADNASAIKNRTVPVF